MTQSPEPEREVPGSGPGAEAAPQPNPPSPTPPRGSRGRGHHVSQRGLQRVPVSPLKQGKFGRIFQDLPPLELAPDQVNFIVDLMRESVVDAGAGGGGWQPTPSPDLDSGLPSAYTYLGQFLDHDITFDPVSSLDRQEDPDALHNFRTPRLDLDSVYGAGPQDQPYLYDDPDNALLLAGPNALNEPDLPRNAQGRALIGDPRNDENVIVSQLHLALINAHNKLVGELREGKYPDERRFTSDDRDFRDAQLLLRWHYQYIVATDFLPRICGGIVPLMLLPEPPEGEPTWEGRLKYAAPPGGRLRYEPRNRPYMPVEFAVAAYRFGHSQPRPGYALNADVQAALFVQDPRGADDTRHLGGFRPLLPGWTVDWARFLDLGSSELQPARLIDRRIAEPLFFLGKAPPEPADQDGVRQRQLPWRNIMRGLALGLPSGEAIARELGVAVTPIPELRERDIPETPLWYYVLAEAEDPNGPAGERLGEVGARIVAEVILGLLKADRTSFLRTQPAWKPFLGTDESTPAYQLSDLVRYAKGL